MTRSFVELEIFRRRAKWSEQIVNKDKDFQDYAGADLDTALKLALLDTILRNVVTDANLALLIKFYRKYLLQKRKAYFCSVRANEVTLLAFLKGKAHDTISATA